MFKPRCYLAIHLLEQNPKKISWYKLSKNQNAIHLLKERYLNFYEIFSNIHVPLRNQGIFEIDYLTLKNKIVPFKEELIQKCFHPDRLTRYLKTYNYDIGEDDYQD